MGNHKHFQAWLRLARSLDWSLEHRDATCVRAFSALQLAVEKCTRDAVPLAASAGPRRQQERSEQI